MLYKEKKNQLKSLQLVQKGKFFKNLLKVKIEEEVYYYLYYEEDIFLGFLIFSQTYMLFEIFFCFFFFKVISTNDYDKSILSSSICISLKVMHSSLAVFFIGFYSFYLFLLSNCYSFFI